MVIACLGDSITAGNFITWPWPQKMAVLLGGTATVGNHGISSDTAALMQTRYTNNIAGKGYTHLVLLGGINDIVAGASASATWATLQAILDAARVAGMKLVVVTVFPFSAYAGWTAEKQAELVALNASITAYASTWASVCGYWDGYTAMGTGTALKAAYDAFDGLHPNQAGTDLIAAEVAAVLPQ